MSYCFNKDFDGQIESKAQEIQDYYRSALQFHRDKLVTGLSLI